MRTVLALFSRCQLCLLLEYSKALPQLLHTLAHPISSGNPQPITLSLTCCVHPHPFRTACPSFGIATGTIVLRGWETRISLLPTRSETKRLYCVVNEITVWGLGSCLVGEVLALHTHQDPSFIPRITTTMLNLVLHSWTINAREVEAGGSLGVIAWQPRLLWKF